MPTKLRDALAIALFVVLAGYVTFSGIRLGLLLWQRFG
jgi:hypothetical protein